MKRERQQGDIISVERHNRDFVMIDNSAVRDPNLGLKATGLLSLLISYPSNWKISLSHLCGVKPDGRDSILSGLAELSQAGYLLYLRWRDAGGLWSSRYIIFETPQLKEKYLEQMSKEDIEKITTPFSPSKAKAKKQNISQETTTENPQWNENGKTVTENPQWKNRNGEPDADKYIDTNTDQKDVLERSPLTPQGESERGGIESEAILVSSEDLGQEPTEDLTTQQSPKQNHRPEQTLNPGVRHPAAVESDPRFLPTDTTAENIATWKQIVATGAMKGASSPDPSFLEYYRDFLGKCSAYKGRDCNLNHAKASLKSAWQKEPLRILAEAENWQKSKAKPGTSTQTRDAMSIPREERLAIARAIQERKQAQQQAKGA